MGSRVYFGGGYDDIEELAHQWRTQALEKMGKTGSPPRARDFLEWIVERFGGRIEVESPVNAVTDNSGSLRIRGKANFVIRLSPYTSPLRDNFTLAHELGHYFLHYDPDQGQVGKEVVFERYGSDIFEREANRFAAALLMPKREFRDVFRKHRGDLYTVAGYFGVSVEAAKVRAQYILED